jgi:hypothetical protein
MKMVLLLTASLFVCASIASGQGKILTNDPLTGLPLMPPRDSAKKFGNEPVKMPDATICKSKFQGNFYKLYDYFAKDNIKLTDGLAWYTSHLSGFKKFEFSNHSKTIFYKPDRTILVIVDSASHTADGVAKLDSAAYERYDPGLLEKTIIEMPTNHIVCK